MKLWYKIAIICSGVLIMAVTLCSAMIFMQARNSIVQQAKDQVLEKLTNTQSSFTQMMGYYYNKDNSSQTQRSIAKYCFSQFADETTILTVGGEPIYSQIDISNLALPSYLLSGQGNDQPPIYESGQLLIAGNSIWVGETSYDIFVVKDISAVYESVSRVLAKSILVSAGFIVAGVLIVILLLKKALRPLTLLRAAAGKISSGDYSKRAEVTTRDEIGELSTEFNKMADSVQQHVLLLTQTSQRQRLFISAVSHEFKTPLSAIIIHSDTLLNVKMSATATRTSVEYIRQESAWLERLIQKFLKLISLQESIVLEPVQKSVLFDAVKTSMQDSLAGKEVNLVIQSDDASVWMDFDLMKSLLMNLIDNAAKASQTGQSIEITSFENVIEVRDHGHGIPREDLEHVMEPFFVVDRSRSKKNGGFGLGLAIVSEIAKAHSASIVIESEQNAGTLVRIIFPDNSLKTKR